MIHNTSRRLGARSLVALTAMALPGVVPLLTATGAAYADGPVSAGSKRHYKPSRQHQYRPGQGPGQGKTTKTKKRWKPGGLPRQAVISLGTGAPGVPVLPGRTYTWPFSVTNSGPVAAGPVVFSTPLPKSLEFVSAQQNCSFKGSMAVCELGPMKPGESRMGVLTAKVSQQVKPREAISSTAAVSWGNSRVTRAFPSVNVAETADVSVTKAGPALVRPGQVVPYELTVRNHGPAAAQSVVLTDVVESRPGGAGACAGSGPLALGGPAGGQGGAGQCENGSRSVPFQVLGAKSPAGRVESGVGCSQRGTGTVCSVGTLSAGQEKKVTLSIQVGPKARPGMVIQSPAKVTSATTDLNLGNNQASVRTKVRGQRPGVAVIKSKKPLTKLGAGLGTGHGAGAPAQGGIRPGGVPGGGGMHELPRTGAESGVLVDVALGLVGTGLILYRLGRRRSRRDLETAEST